MTPADELAVRNLLARIAHLADTGDLAEYARWFTADAEWQLPADAGVDLDGQVRRGVDDIVAGARERRAAGIQGPGTATRHVVTTTAVQAIGPDRASARSYWRYYGDTTGTPRLRTMGHYDDVFLRTADGWRLHRRRITRG